MGYTDSPTGTDPVGLAAVSVMSIALYNVLELNVIIFSFFKRKSGLYFWSFFLATWGIVFHTVSHLTWNLGFLTNGPAWVTIAVIGWVPMVTCQSLVLYSRLHLIVHDQKILRPVLVMIITNVFIGHVPAIIIAYGSVVSLNPEPYIIGYSVYEKIQVSLFFLQEVIISSLYIWHTYRALHVWKAIHGTRVYKMLRHLVLVNVVIIILDVSVLVLEYNSLYNMQTAIKGMAYSIKLKVEYTVLNSLINLTKANIGRSNSHGTSISGLQSHNEFAVREPSS
ncbi:hypothetical protein DL769_009640 [Monosporascus sp. CRB-8-3]|nr:hypothetical protein DL769_009640 [Monosporascus sp. CRB-8-3]